MKIVFFDSTVMHKYWTASLNELEINHISLLKDNEDFEKVRDTLEKFNPDILIGSVLINPKKLSYYEKIKQWGKQNNKCLAWITTQDPNFNFATCKQALGYDYVFTCASECVEDYKKIGCEKVGIVPLGYNPLWSKYSKEEKIYDVVLLGNYYLPSIERECYEKKVDRHQIKPGYKNIIRPLIKNGYNVKIWGHKDNWLKSGFVSENNLMDYILYTRHAEIYNKAKICISINSNQYSPTMMSWRAYEIPACKAFCLSAWSKATENVFTDGKDLVISNSPEDTLRLVDKYLNNDTERDRIANNGYEAVKDKHSVKQRIIDMLKFIDENGGKL